MSNVCHELPRVIQLLRIPHVAGRIVIQTLEPKGLTLGDSQVEFRRSIKRRPRVEVGGDLVVVASSVLRGRLRSDRRVQICRSLLLGDHILLIL